MSDLTATVTKEIQAPIEVVFDAWLNPDTLTKFMMPLAEMECPKVQCDPKLGGKFEILMKVGENLVPHTGEYVALERPNTLGFTWISPASVENSVVTLQFSSKGENTTLVELTHNNFVDEQHRSNHEEGWGSILVHLNRLVG